MDTWPLPITPAPVRNCPYSFEKLWYAATRFIGPVEDWFAFWVSVNIVPFTMFAICEYPLAP